MRDLRDFDVVQNWKECCRISVCLVDEIWLRGLSAGKKFFKHLAQFDYVFLYYSQSVKAISNIIGRNVSFCRPVRMPFYFAVSRSA